MHCVHSIILSLILSICVCMYSLFKWGHAEPATLFSACAYLNLFHFHCNHFDLFSVIILFVLIVGCVSVSNIHSLNILSAIKNVYYFHLLG